MEPSSCLYVPAKYLRDVESYFSDIREFVGQKTYPCMPARKSLEYDDYCVGIYSGLMGENTDSAQILRDLLYFRQQQRSTASLYMTHWAIFPDTSAANEDEFERMLWRELSRISAQQPGDVPWDKNFSSDPTKHNFCPSFGGDAFFIVGMHPVSSRKARQFKHTAIVFNLYDQFEELERRGAYASTVQINRAREMKFFGSVNPMVEKYGDQWESIQFSGKNNPPDWQCPFEHLPRQIPRQSGAAFSLSKGQILVVRDPQGQQVADLFCAAADNPLECLSTSRSMDYSDNIFLTKGHTLYSNQSRPMLAITHDTCGRHDLLMPPCSLKMFQTVAGNTESHPSCHENLAKHLGRFDVAENLIGTTFNIFMNVCVQESGEVKILPPLSKPGAYVEFRAEMDLIVGLTACSHPESNAGVCKPIDFQIISRL